MEITLNKETNIKSYYMQEYPTDELGLEIKSHITFEDLFYTLDSYEDVYKFLGVHDSLVRERCFTHVAKIMKCDYDYIYQQWLKGK